jgi:hypothetical protein
MTPKQAMTLLRSVGTVAKSNGLYRVNLIHGGGASGWMTESEFLQFADRELAPKANGKAGEHTTPVGAPTVVPIALDLIRTDGGTQARSGLDLATVAEYAETWQDLSYQQNGLSRMPPIVVYHDGDQYWLADGFHRVAAYKQFLEHGKPSASPRALNAEVRAGTRRDAVLHACGANASHGLRRTNADKRRAVETLLRDDEWRQWSDRKIADACAVSDKTVAAVRQDLGAEIPHVIERQGMDGKVYTAPPSRPMRAADIAPPGLPARWFMTSRPGADGETTWYRAVGPYNQKTGEHKTADGAAAAARAIAEMTPAREGAINLPDGSPAPETPESRDADGPWFWAAKSAVRPTAHCWHTSRLTGGWVSACGLEMPMQPTHGVRGFHCGVCEKVADRRQIVPIPQAPLGGVPALWPDPNALPPLDQRLMSDWTRWRNDDGQIGMKHRSGYKIGGTDAAALEQQALSLTRPLFELGEHGWHVTYDPGAEGHADLHPYVATHDEFSAISGRDLNDLAFAAWQARHDDPARYPDMLDDVIEGLWKTGFDWTGMAWVRGYEKIDESTPENELRYLAGLSEAPKVRDVSVPTIEDLDATMPKDLFAAGYYWHAAEPPTVAHNDGWRGDAPTPTGALKLARDRMRAKASVDWNAVARLTYKLGALSDREQAISMWWQIGALLGVAARVPEVTMAAATASPDDRGPQ